MRYFHAWKKQAQLTTNIATTFGICKFRKRKKDLERRGREGEGKGKGEKKIKKILKLVVVPSSHDASTSDKHLSQIYI